MGLSTVEELIMVSVRVYKSHELAKIIEEIKQELNQVYSDIAGAHFNSAKQAFTAAQHSSSHEQEVRSGIAHLRDAFNIYEALLNKEKPIKGWFGGITGYSKVVEGEDRAKIYMGNCQIAILIGCNYADLGEISNARTWKAYAINSAIKYGEIISDVSAEALCAINRNLVVPTN